MSSGYYVNETETHLFLNKQIAALLATQASFKKQMNLDTVKQALILVRRLLQTVHSAIFAIFTIQLCQANSSAQLRQNVFCYRIVLN